MNEHDELDEIFVDKNENLDKKLLLNILKPYVLIDKDGAIEFKEAYDSLQAWKKILVYLSCKKAMKHKGIQNEESASPKEISDNARISASMAKKIAIDKRLAKIVKNIEGTYIIPNYNLHKVVDILANGDKVDNDGNR